MNETYLIIEIQVNATGQAATIVNQRNTRNEAESAYHAMMAAAAVSSVPLHSVVMMTPDGNVIMNGSYTHE